MPEAAPKCSVCRDLAYRCDACGGFAIEQMASTAIVRGGRWADRTVRKLVARWPRWRRTERAKMLAERRVADMAETPEERAHLARICLDAAAARFRHIVALLLDEDPDTAAKLMSDEDEDA
jgi:hypothetical protein